MVDLFGEEVVEDDDSWEADLDEFAEFLPIAEPFEYMGNQATIGQLNTLIAKQTIPHAILFAGEQGIGKFTLAQALAHSLLSGKEEISFENDATLHRMQQGSHMDYLYIAPNQEEGKKKQVISIDQIRGISGFLHKTRGESSIRVIIIDGAESMNANAANALLKNLEEPPAGTLMILISHNAASLLPTIRSRLRIFQFAPLKTSNCLPIIKRSLEEPETYSEEDIELINSLTDARPGLATTWLEAGAADMYRGWLELVTKSEKESKQMGLVVAFSEEITGDRKMIHQNFEIFSNLLLLFIKRAVTLSPENIADTQEREAIANWLERVQNPSELANYWFLLKQQFSLTQRLHLEYKNNLITTLLRLVRGQPPLELR